MKRAHLAFLVCFACAPASDKPSTVSLDIRKLAQTGEVAQLGLLIIGAPLADAATETAAVESTEGEASTTAAPAETMETGVSIGLDLEMMTTPSRQTAEPTNGGLVLPKAVSTVEDGAVRVSYFSIEIARSETTFSIDVPPGRSQSLFLYGFGPKPADGRAPLPAYIAAATNVDLLPAAEQEVHFAAYPAGVLAPQVLAPSLIGLVDKNGLPVTSLPPDLSCLAVARALTPRADFPAEMVGRVRIGSLTAQAQTVNEPGVLVLPEGKYNLECYANFAGKLFGFDPKRPVVASVERGKVTVSTASLIRLRDLVVEGTTTPGTMTPGTEPGTEPLPGTMLPGGVREPRFHLQFGVTQPPVARGDGSGSTAYSPESNLDNTSLPMSIEVVAVKDDGSVDTSFNGEVQLGVVAAFDDADFGTDQFDGGRWKPFPPTVGPVAPEETTSVFVVDGRGELISQFRQDAHNSPTEAPYTRSYILTARSINTFGLPSRIGGARYFTVRADTNCRDQQFGGIAGFVLSSKLNTLQVMRGGNAAAPTFNRLTEHALFAALSPVRVEMVPSDTSRCAFHFPGGMINSAPLNVVPFGAGSRDKVAFNAPFVSAFLDSESGFTVNFDPAATAGQKVLYDVIAAAPAYAPGLGVNRFQLKLYGPASVYAWTLDIETR